MLLPHVNHDGVVVARGIAAVVNLSKDDHYKVLSVVLNALHLLLDVPCVELWDIVYFVPKEDVALLLRYSKLILCYMRLELPQVTIAIGILFQEGRVWIGILEWLNVMLCQGPGSSRSSVFQPFYDTYKDNSRSIMSGGERFTIMYIKTFLPSE